MKWIQLSAMLGLATLASLGDAQPTTSTSCYTVRVSGTRRITSSLPPQTRRPTVTRPFVTPTSFTVTVPLVTTFAPDVTPTVTEFFLTPAPGTVTVTSTTYTVPPGPTLPVVLPPPPPPPRREIEAATDADLERREVVPAEPEPAQQERDAPCPAGEEEVILDRRASQQGGDKIDAGSAQAAQRRLRGRRIYCRRIVRLDPITVRATKTRTVTVKTTVRPTTMTTRTIRITSTSSIFSSVFGAVITAAPTTSTITADPVTITSTRTAATTTTTVTILIPQPTVIVPRLRSIYCGPLARPFSSNFIAVGDFSNQALQFIDPPGPEDDCCDAASNIPGALAYSELGGMCVVDTFNTTPQELCVAGNPSLFPQFNTACTESCYPGGLLQCAAPI
ncbi:hypothetical protein V8E36_006660 [Tilletia maclaganii]